MIATPPKTVVMATQVASPLSAGRAALLAALLALPLLAGCQSVPPANGQVIAQPGVAAVFSDLFRW